MPKIQPVAASSNAYILIHSDPGCGKTTLIGTGGKEYKTLVIRSVVDHADPIIGSGVEEMVIHNWDDMMGNDGAVEYVRHEGHNWDWVWWDSASLTQDVLLDDVFQGVVDRKGAARANYGPDRGEYRVNMWRIEQFVRHVVGAGGFNFGIMAHSFPFTDPDAEQYATQLMPWIQGKMMPQKICGMMNVVGYMEVRKRTVRGEERESRVIHFNKSPHYYAKCQFKLPDGSGVFGESGSMVNPTMPKIVEAISKGRTSARRRTTRRRTQPKRGSR